MKHADRHHRGGKWLPADPDRHAQWLSSLINEVRKSPSPLHPVIDEFRAFIESDAQAYMLFNQMFEQRDQAPPLNSGASAAPRIRDFEMLLRLFNALLTRAPEFDRSGVVGTPFAAVLDQLVRTPAGFTTFLQDRINDHLRDILNEWARFLSSADSCAVLTEDPRHGWFGKDAMEEMPNFVREFECDPAAPHFGFRSWDEFFTRRFREAARPVENPDDDDVVVNPCEAAPYRLAKRVKERDRFWIKSQPYSLRHMLAADPLAERFVGGTVYQAYLSALSYHRWHAPVSGTVVKAYLQPGSYFSEPPIEAVDPEASTQSQAYLAEVATRGLIFIEADNPKLGLVAFLPVGMGEVSTCQITAYEGQHIRKGDELGMFHFGGSTLCLLFGPDADVTFDLHGQKPGAGASNIPVRARIAQVS